MPSSAEHPLYGPTATTTQMLDSLKDAGNAAVWTDFDGRYRPIIQRVALRMGLSAEDASDVAQQTLTDFVRDYRLGKYDRGKGRLRHWVMGIARHRALDLLRSQSTRKERHGDSVIMSLPDDQTVSSYWEVEQRKAIFSAAWEEYRTSGKASDVNLQAFELVAIQGMPAEAVAAQLNISPDLVYKAKSRGMMRLREIIERVTKAYEADE